MKTRQLLILLIIVCNVRFVFGQLTEEALASALARKECFQIASELEKTPLLSEGMKFNGAVCYYRNGDTMRALTLFREVRQLEAQKQHIARFWEAKCHAAFHEDSLALAHLQAIPAGILNPGMLSQPEFSNLARNNKAFVQLKQALEPRFNIWTSMLAVIAVLGLLIGFVLLFGRSRFSAGEKRLSVVVFSFSVILISYVLIWTGYVFKFPYLQNTWQFLTLLVGPSLYFYLKDTFKEDYTFKKAAWHYLITALSGLATIPAFLSNFGIQTGVSNDVFLIGASPALLNAHLLFYALQIHSMTQNEWQVDANIKVWTRVVALGMMLYTFAFISYFVLVNCSFFNPEWDYAISTVMALSILVIAYMGLVQKRVFSSEPIGNFLPVKKYQTSSLTESASASIKKRMERLLVEEQVFKENELRLADLATYLDISRHQLSQVINEHYGVNFFELINTYRVEHVKRLLADPNYKHYTVIQIAYEAGFNNKASFNRYFKREIGMTPSAYRIKEGSVS
ncbi:MAG: helix-turn-helix domain-containing protein [Saprospiraceae bacterium]|nr:helix-turn-helix domain-containing protein [Saprospiraceae bacterium]